MAEPDNSRNKWVIPLVAVVVMILIAIIIIVILISLDTEGVSADCSADQPCKTGLVCTRGKCKIANGDFCETDDQCASGNCKDFFCVTATGPSNNCAATGAAACPSGEVCDASSGKCLSTLGNPCTLNNDCVQPSVCVIAPIPPSSAATTANTQSPGICLGSSGAVCTTDTQCLSGVCNIPSGGSTGTCSTPTSTTLPARTSEPSTMTNTLLPGRSMTPAPSFRVGRTSFGMETTPVNQTFCVESGLSRTERAVNFRTPSPQELEAPFKKIHKDMVMSRVDTKQSPVIDVTNYSNVTLALMQDGRIIRERDDNRRDDNIELVANNVRLKRLEAFFGTLYGVSVDGRLFALNNDTFRTRKWTWNLTPFPSGVVHTSATLDGNHFWVQTKDTGFLYDRDLNIVERHNTTDRKRVYGDNRRLYVDINLRNNTAMLHPNGDRIDNVAGAVITHDDKVKILKPSQTAQYSDIRLVRWKPTFIRRVV